MKHAVELDPEMVSAFAASAAPPGWQRERFAVPHDVARDEATATAAPTLHGAGDVAGTLHDERVVRQVDVRPGRIVIVRRGLGGVFPRARARRIGRATRCRALVKAEAVPPPEVERHDGPRRHVGAQVGRARGEQRCQRHSHSSLRGHLSGVLRQG